MVLVDPVRPAVGRIPITVTASGRSLEDEATT